MIGKPIFQQHGDNDHNVPAYHSRRMHQLLAEAGGQSEYQEVPGRDHWWEGVATQGRLPELYKEHLEENPAIPELPQEFSIVVANPADMGSRGGIKVDQLLEPDR